MLLEINAWISGDQLQVHWLYSRSIHRRDRIETLAQDFLLALQQLIAHCISPQAGGFTPSDFPLMSFAPGELDAFLSAEQARTHSEQNIADLYPLSPMQQGLLFHTLLAPGAGVYVPQVTFEMEGLLRMDALRQSWEEAIAAHSILRTSFHWEKRDQPFQRVQKTVPLRWVEQDWSALAAPQQQEKLSMFLAFDRNQAFDLKSPPLLRLALLKLSPQRHRLVLTYHHLILDGWSVSNLLRDVFQQYFETASRPQTASPPLSPLPSLPSLSLLSPSPPSPLKSSSEQRHGHHKGQRPYSDYRDYIVWLNQQDQNAAQSFWQDYLAGVDQPTPLPLDRGDRSLLAQNKGSGILKTPEAEAFAEVSIQLNEETTTALRTAAQQAKITLNTLLQGAFAVLLSQYGNRSEVVFGNTVGGRPAALPHGEERVGLFINTLPVRARISPAASLGLWLQQLQEQQAAASVYEHSSLSQIQEWSDFPAGAALFSSLLVFENYPVDTRLLEAQAEAQASGNEPLHAIKALRFSDLAFHEWTSFPLTLLVSSGVGSSLTLKYSCTRLINQSAQQLLEHLQVILQKMAATPKAPLQDFFVPSPSHLSPHQQPSLKSFTQPGLLGEKRNYRWENCLPDRFETQVAKTPEAIALRFETDTLTYQALNQRANRLAHYLQRHGTGPEVRVAVYLKRSLERVVALLAILKAGGTYVPLDPDYPSDRLNWMLDDVEAALLLTDSRQTLVPLAVPESCKTVDLEAVQEAIDPLPTTNLQTLIQPENSIYIIYTSGSTGRPKGVVNHHQGITNRLAWMQERYRLNSSDRLLQKTSFSFDVSVWELFWPLLTGAELVLAKPGGHRDNVYLSNLIEACQITTVHFVPAMLSAFLEGPQLRQKCRSLRRVICSGEALSKTLQNQFFEQLDAELHNLYGPTEAAIDVTAYQCQRAATEQPSAVVSDASTVSIGKPIANTQIYLLNHQNQPVPLGCVGELCIAGVGVARGYWKRPALTAERFIPNPFAAPLADSFAGSENGSVPARKNADYLYKTGDMARFTADGSIEYLGRLDQQIKLRGVRIETGEIEAQLEQHPQVQQAVVQLQPVSAGSTQSGQTPSGGDRLIAYWVPVHPPAEVDEKPSAPATTTSADELLRWLGQRLPAVMVPQNFVELSALPLTANGKLDRKALPLPEHLQAAAPVMPRNSTERAIAQIWQTVLQLETVGIHDNFFELGGNSLSATRVHMRLQTRLTVDLPLRAQFEQPTIAALAAQIDALKLAQRARGTPERSPSDASSGASDFSAQSSETRPSANPLSASPSRRKEIEL